MKYRGAQGLLAVPRRKAHGDLRGELDLLNSDEPHEEAELLLSAEVTGSLRRKSGPQAFESTALKPTLLV